jgi:hypothetical protein
MKDDFDLLTSFDIERLSVSAGLDDLELSIALGGKDPSVAMFLASRARGGKLRLTARLQPAGGVNQTPREVATAEVDSLDGLRIARIQRTVFYLYSEDGFFRLLGMTDADPGEVPPGAVRFQVGGDPNAPAEVLLKAVELRASEFTK